MTNGKAETSPDSMILLDCDGIAVVILRGEFDMATADELKAFLSQQVSAGLPLVVDLTDVEFADSCTFSVFVGIDKQLRAVGRSLILQVTDTAPAFRPMLLMGLEAHFTCAPSRDAAFALARESAGVEG